MESVATTISGPPFMALVQSGLTRAMQVCVYEFSRQEGVAITTESYLWREDIAGVRR
jgi:hypothetical protein